MDINNYKGDYSNSRAYHAGSVVYAVPFGLMLALTDIGAGTPFPPGKSVTAWRQVTNVEALEVLGIDPQSMPGAKMDWRTVDNYEEPWIQPDTYMAIALLMARRGQQFESALSNVAMGIGGEGGEIQDVLKKLMYHGDRESMMYDPEELPDAVAVKLLGELGDLQWYLNRCAFLLGFTLQDVMEFNLRKLLIRYPEGKFDPKHSANREAADQLIHEMAQEFAQRRFGQPVKDIISDLDVAGGWKPKKWSRITRSEEMAIAVSNGMSESPGKPIVMAPEDAQRKPMVRMAIYNTWASSLMSSARSAKLPEAELVQAQAYRDVVGVLSRDHHTQTRECAVAFSLFFQCLDNLVAAKDGVKGIKIRAITRSLEKARAAINASESEQGIDHVL